MKKLVLKLEFNDDKTKQKIMQKVSGLSGVEAVAIDAKDKKLTVIGDIDPVGIVAKLRKLCHTEIVSVGPAKEPEKKKDEQPKKEDDKKQAGGGGGDNKKDSKADAVKAYPPQLAYPQYYYPSAYQQHYPPQLPYQYNNHYPSSGPAYYAKSVEEDPNSCVIC